MQVEHGSLDAGETLEAHGARQRVLVARRKLIVLVGLEWRLAVERGVVWTRQARAAFGRQAQAAIDRVRDQHLLDLVELVADAVAMGRTSPVERTSVGHVHARDGDPALGQRHGRHERAVAQQRERAGV